MNETSTKKSQLIVFNESGKIISSCNSLFNASRLSGKSVFDVFPVLNCIKEIIQKHDLQSEPLFLPHIAFTTYKYRSICDFVFVQKNTKSGVLISWLINDNSMHYKNILSANHFTRYKSSVNYFTADLNTGKQKQNFIR